MFKRFSHKHRFVWSSSLIGVSAFCFSNLKIPSVGSGRDKGGGLLMDRPKRALFFTPWSSDGRNARSSVWRCSVPSGLYTVYRAMNVTCSVCTASSDRRVCGYYSIQRRVTQLLSPWQAMLNISIEYYTITLLYTNYITNNNLSHKSTTSPIVLFT